MSDLVAGRYPLSYENWLLDGAPNPPYRYTTSGSRQIGAGTFTLILTGTLYVYPVVVQAGDIFNYVTLLVKTSQTVGGHAWAALYNGTTSAATLLGQVADNTSGWGTGAQKLQFTAAVGNSPTVGTPQGPSTAAVTPSGAAVFGLVLYNSAASGTGTILDAATVGGDVAGNIALTGQIPVTQTATYAASATAPASLGASGVGTLTAASANVPYAVLSRQ